MRYFYSVILLVFAVIAFYHAAGILINRNYKKITYQIFSIMSMASGIWGVGYGLMYFFDDEKTYSIARTVGMMGILLFIICGQIIIGMLTEKFSKFLWLIIPETIIGYIVIRSVTREGTYVIEHTDMGYVTYFSSTAKSVIYTGYLVLVAAIYVYFSVRMVRQKDNHKLYTMGKALLKMAGVIIFGMIFDTLLPAFGINPNIPTTAIFQFGALYIFSKAISKYNRNQIIEDNVARYVYNVIKTPVMVMDKNHKLAIANTVALNYLGNPTHWELSKIDVWKLLFDREPPEFVVKTNDVATITMDVEVKHLDLFCRISIDPIFDDFGDYIGYVMTLADITDHIEKMRLKEATEMKTAFLANMSHEIRTPLNAIIGFNDAIVQNAGKNEKVLGYAKNISEAGENLKDIINSILDISKIEMGQLDIESKEYNTISMLDNLASMFEMLAKKKGLDFYVDIDPKLPEVMIGDEVHIRQILTNILSNAVKYTDEGSVTLKVKVMYKESGNPSQKILFSVKDTGRGIRKEDRAKLFEKFQRLDTEHFKHTEGTGLGMSIVLYTLRAMGSDIQLESEYGKGSKFYFILDQIALNEETIGDFNERRSQNIYKEFKSISFRAPEAKVLIVDDVQMNIDAAMALLEYTKMQLDYATSGREAIHKIRENKYDIVFMDHMMPEMDGIECAKIIRESSMICGDPYFAMVPIIALTANAIVGVREMYMNAGMQDFVSKPIELKTMISVLRKWLPADKVLDVDGEDVAAELETDINAWGMEIPGIDVDEAMNYNPGKDGLEKNMKSFIKAYDGNRKELTELFTTSDTSGYVIKVHGLKSTSKMIGAMELSEAALDMEMKGKDGILLSEDFDKLMALYGDCIKNLKTYFNMPLEDETVSSDEMQETGEQSSSEGISEEEYQSLLARIKEAADNFDAGAFMMMDDELESIKVGPEHKEEFDKITAWISLLSFGEISEYLSN